MYAFHHGGATAVGVFTFVRLAVAAVVAPLAASIGDRYRRERVMIGSDLARVATVSVAAVAVFTGAPSLVVYALATLTTVVGTVFRPAEAALLPTLARSPEELTAANLSSSTFDSVGLFAGPALGAALLVVGGPGTVFCVTVATFVWSALAAHRRAHGPAGRRDGGGSRTSTAASGPASATIRAEPRLRLVIGLYGAQCIVAGVFNVLIVATALDLLGLGNAGVGLLEAVLGVGALVGAAVVLTLVGRKRLAADFGLGLVLWSSPLVVLGLLPNTAVALVALDAGRRRQHHGRRHRGHARSARLAARGRRARVRGAREHAGRRARRRRAAGARADRGNRDPGRPPGRPASRFRCSRRSAGGSSRSSTPAPRCPMTVSQQYARCRSSRPSRSRRSRGSPPGSSASSSPPARCSSSSATSAIASSSSTEGAVEIDLPEGVKIDGAPCYLGEIALLHDIPRTATVRASRAEHSLGARARRLPHRGPRPRPQPPGRGRDRFGAARSHCGTVDNARLVVVASTTRTADLGRVTRVRVVRPMLLIGVAVAAALLFVGGATARGTGVSTALVPTVAHADRYLSSLGLDPAGFVVQHGARNYAGAKCPGKGWTCTKAKRVLQIASSGGVNAVVCAASSGSAHSTAGTTAVGCTIVQTSTSGSNTATCNEQSVGDLATLTQTCTITQTSGSGNNTATVVQGFAQGPITCSTPFATNGNQTQSGTQYAYVTQGSASGNEAANVSQTVAQCASTTTTGATAQSQTTDQEFTIQQGPVTFTTPNCANDTGKIDATASQSQHQHGYATSATTGSQGQQADLIGHVDQCSIGRGRVHRRPERGSEPGATSANVAQTQIGPTSLTGLPKVHGKRTLLRGQCCSFQGTNPTDTCTITQTTNQVANANASQTENLTASAGTTGKCNGNVKATENGQSFTSTQTDTSSLNAGLTCSGQNCVGVQVPTALVWTVTPAGTYDDDVTLSAKLTQTDSNTPVGGMPINFTAGGVSCSGTTDPTTGIASCTGTVTDQPGGSYTAAASFAGTSAYLPSSTPATAFPVAKQPTLIVFTGDTSADFDDSASLQATVYEAHHTAKPVNLDPGSVTSMGIGSQGCPDASITLSGPTASCAISLVTQDAGVVQQTATYNGNPYFDVSSATADFNILHEETQLQYTGPTSVDYTDPVTLKATLTEDGVLPLSGKTVLFTLGTQSCSGVTSTSGVASCPLVVNQQSGVTPFTVSFAQDLDYAQTSVSPTFTITHEENTLSYTGPTSAKKGSAVTLTAKLSHESAGLAGETLVFKVGTQTCTPVALTNSSGVASCTLTLSQNTGATTVKVTFAGDPYYQSNSASKTFTIKS